jgi:phospholipid/cholesterol/gamma-HCH transport system ATP-binding protein|tara:strand:- start:99 stop:857 length:759 start_codon:yes stop_codon:yes gene_type:complete
MIEVQNLSKSFKENLVLDDISVKLERGKTNLIIGESGSGKTTFLKCLIGLHSIDNGEILFDNREFSKMNDKNIRKFRQEIGVLFQGGALYDYLSVEENIMFPLNMFTKFNLKEKKERVNFCLSKVNLEKTNNLFPSELSGGMTKRVAIARAIALNPKYLFCDEPNSGLDPKTAILIDNLILEITEEFNITTIVNTHDMNSVIQIGSNILFIHKGKILWKGNKNDLTKSKNNELNNFVFASKLFKTLRNENFT